MRWFLNRFGGYVIYDNPNIVSLIANYQGNPLRFGIFRNINVPDVDYVPPTGKRLRIKQFKMTSSALSGGMEVSDIGYCDSFTAGAPDNPVSIAQIDYSGFPTYDNSPVLLTDNLGISNDANSDFLVPEGKLIFATGQGLMFDPPQTTIILFGELEDA